MVSAGNLPLKWASYIFFYGYVGTLIVAGVWGVFFARIDMPLLLNVQIDHLPPVTAANLLSQYRFLRAIEIGFGVLAITFRNEIFHDQVFNRLFLVIMAGGIAGRILGLVFDGIPSIAMLFFLTFEVVGITLIFAFTRETVRTR